MGGICLIIYFVAASEGAHHRIRSAPVATKVHRQLFCKTKLGRTQGGRRHSLHLPVSVAWVAPLHIASVASHSPGNRNTVLAEGFNQGKYSSSSVEGCLCRSC